MKKEQHDLSIRCFFPGKDNYTQHNQTMPLSDIPKWMEAYRFTHPNLTAISVKVWFKKEGDKG